MRDLLRRAPCSRQRTRHGESKVVPPGNSRALRAAMDELHQNPGKAREIGVNVRNRYEQLFTGSLMGQRYAEAYQRVLESSA